MVSLISLNGGQEVNHFPQAPGARSASLATRRSARGAVAPSGPLRSPARRPFEIAPRRPAVPPATSWPDLPGLVPGIRPSIGPRTREEAWRREMPGTSPGMTRWVGRSGVGHEEGRTAGPEHATACRAAWRVGKRAELAPAVEGNEREEMRAGYRRYGPPASAPGPSLKKRRECRDARAARSPQGGGDARTAYKFRKQASGAREGAMKALAAAQVGKLAQEAFSRGHLRASPADRRQYCARSRQLAHRGPTGGMSPYPQSWGFMRRVTT